jgi:hypothetical protein
LLCVIDVLARFRTPASGRNAYAEDYAALAKLQELATRRSITIIVVHHTRKGVSEDPVEEISGTLGLSGSADAFLVLKRTSSGATLSGRGRDTDDVDLAVQFSKDTCRWTILGEAADIHRSDQRTSVLAVLAAGPAGVREIMAEAGIRSQDAAWQLLHRMAKAGEITRCGHGKYSLPDIPLSGPLSGLSGCQEGSQFVDDTGVKHHPDNPDNPDRGGRASGNAAGKPKRHAPKLSEPSGEDAAEFLKSTGWKS